MSTIQFSRYSKHFTGLCRMSFGCAGLIPIEPNSAGIQCLDASFYRAFLSSTGAYVPGGITVNSGVADADRGIFWFKDVLIPQGAVINDATFDLVLSPSDFGGGDVVDVDFVVKYEDTANSEFLKNRFDYGDFTWGGTTTGTINVANTWGISAPAYSFDLTTMIQNIINKTTWYSGNAISLSLDLTAWNAPGDSVLIQPRWFTIFAPPRVQLCIDWEEVI